MLEGCKYLCQAQVHNLVTILYQIYCYVHKNTDKQYLSFLVCGSHHFIVAILFV